MCIVYICDKIQLIGEFYSSNINKPMIIKLKYELGIMRKRHLCAFKTIVLFNFIMGVIHECKYIYLPIPK